MVKLPNEVFFPSGTYFMIQNLILGNNPIYCHMAFINSEKEKCEELMADFIEKRRPPVDIRDKVDLTFRIEGQSIVIFEVRPFWFDHGKKTESPIAKTTFVRKRRIWKVFWMRSDLKWHSYPLEPEVETLERFLELVDEDSMYCFWG